VAKVADFGLAKSFEAAGLSGLTATGSAAGSPWFMPRQQVINFLYAKPDVDVWAVAASLYNMLTGRFPRNFPPGKDPWRVVLESASVPIQNHLPSIPAKLARVIDHALIDQPEIPIKTAAELKRQLKEAL
jgi:serine/threonine-protein kinase